MNTYSNWPDYLLEEMLKKYDEAMKVCKDRDMAEILYSIYILMDEEMQRRATRRK